MYVDLWYPAVGSSVPSDHGYAVYSALCRILPILHGKPWWGLHTFHGQRDGEGRLLLSRRPELGLRLPAERIVDVLPLAGERLEVEGHGLQLGAPRVQPLVPAGALSARIVTIKGFMEPGPFSEAVRRQLAALAISAEVDVGPRKVVRAGSHRVVGFTLRLEGLTPPASLVLQECGLGGRRRFGCGLFRPSLHPLVSRGEE